MPILRNHISQARGQITQGKLEKELRKLGFKGSLNRIEQGIEVPDKNDALIIAKYFQAAGETIEQALLRLFERVDYNYLFRNKVAENRFSKEQTRGDFAKQLGIGEAVLANIENGWAPPTSDQKDKIKRAFDKSYDEIFTPYPE